MLIYLDIDGVMVTANSWRRPDMLEDGFMDFSPKAVRALNRIISELNAGIVLTTSHKYSFTLSEWERIFKNRNIQVKDISRLPENKNHNNRMQEIMEWFNAHGVPEDFMIIDDDKSLNELPGFLKSKLIQTSGSVGLTDYLADEAINKMTVKLKDFI